MKKRIKIDSTMLAAVIILTVFLYLNKNLYSNNLYFDDGLDFLGFITIIKGSMLRMMARGHKKANSSKSDSLVVSGPYAVTRNPMYLGTFLIGVGFILMVWPWWMLPVYAFIFYLRFNKQMKKEEKYLEEKFGEEYIKYCAKTSRIFPSLKVWFKIKIKEFYSLKEAFLTKEKYLLLALPLLALALETLQEKILFYSFIPQKTLLILVCAAVFFWISLWFVYGRKN